MISKTKYPIDEKRIKALFEAAGIDDVKNVHPLGAGEFNAVFQVTTRTRDYVIKIAPKEDAPILNYEKGMMKAELFWYKQIRENTSIRVPQIFFEDFTRKRISTDYFIMEKLSGKQMNRMHFNKAEREEARSLLARMAAEIHRIKNNRFGYVQTGVYDNWHLALRSMVTDLLEDAKKKHIRSKRGEHLLEEIDFHRGLLERVESRMVNFDLWTPNIICQRQADGSLESTWIDPERSFWGDPIADFVALEFMSNLQEKKLTLQVYNEVAEKSILATKEEQIRFALMQGYLALLMEVEKHYRYTPLHVGWWRNIMVSSLLFKNIWKEISVR